MPVVTGVQPQKHDSERVNVYLDGSFAFGVSMLVAAAQGLREGRTLSAPEIEALRSDDDVEKALAKGLNLLSFRAHSRREMEVYLRRKRVDPEVSAAVILRLEVMGLINDAEFAQLWVNDRQRFRPRGSRALASELRQKGVDAEVISQVLETVGDEEVSAIEAGRKKAKSLGSADDAEFSRKMASFLARRGFPYSTAASTIKLLKAEREASELGNDDRS